MRVGIWKVVNDPGAWGSSLPRVLVLGFLKGFTQCKAGRDGRFEEVPFKGMRRRLSETVNALGLIGCDEDISSRFTEDETDLAFGSLVRCIEISCSTNGRNTIAWNGITLIAMRPLFKTSSPMPPRPKRNRALILLDCILAK